VKYFVYDDKYPFRSEYALDRTAFESSYALAKYGATTDMAPDRDLWFDKGKQKWYSHPVVRREDSRAFMDRQLKAGLAVRGLAGDGLLSSRGGFHRVVRLRLAELYGRHGRLGDPGLWA